MAIEAERLMVYSLSTLFVPVRSRWNFLHEVTSNPAPDYDNLRVALAEFLTRLLRRNLRAVQGQVVGEQEYITVIRDPGRGSLYFLFLSRSHSPPPQLPSFIRLISSSHNGFPGSSWRSRHDAYNDASPAVEKYRQRSIECISGPFSGKIFNRILRERFGSVESTTDDSWTGIEERTKHEMVQAVAHQLHLDDKRLYRKIESRSGILDKVSCDNVRLGISDSARSAGERPRKRGRRIFHLTRENRPTLKPFHRIGARLYSYDAWLHSLFSKRQWNKGGGGDNGLFRSVERNAAD